MSLSSIVHGGQHDTKYVTFELLSHAAFVADAIWGGMLKPARTTSCCNSNLKPRMRGRHCIILVERARVAFPGRHCNCTTARQSRKRFVGKKKTIPPPIVDGEVHRRQRHQFYYGLFNRGPDFDSLNRTALVRHFQHSS